MKKKNLILSFLLIFSSLLVASAQELVNPLSAKIDSIQALLDAQLHKDTVKVKRLNDLALLCTFDMQFQRGILAAKQARQLSQKLNYPKGEGLYLNFMMLISSNSYFGAYYNAKKTLFYADIRGKEDPNKIMDLFPLKRDPEKAIAKLLEAFTYFEKGNDKEMMAHILSCISVNYAMLNKTNESVQYTDRSIKLFKETEKPELAFMALINKITQLHISKKINEANEVEKEAKFIIANTKTVREKALFSFCLGLLYTTNVQNKKALGFEYLLKADYELEKIGEKDLRVWVLATLGFNFDHVGMYQKSMDYFKKVIEFEKQFKQFNYDIAFIYLEVVFELVPLKKFDEAKQYLEKARSFASEIKGKRDRTWFEARNHDASGQLLMGQGKYQEALGEFLQANKITTGINDVDPMYFNSYIAQCYQKLGDWEKSILFGEKSYQQILKTANAEQWLKINTSSLLSEVYEKSGQFKKAFEYSKKYRGHIKEKEEQDIANLSTDMAIENMTQKNEQEKASLEKEKLIKEHENRSQRWLLLSVAAALFSTFIVLFILYRNNRQKQKANAVLEKTLSNLHATQAQLIQSEKLASLGELTAGIAHEIQNPLNFVNNFAEVSAEMLVEMDAELDKGDIQEAKAISADLQQNLSKINHHGQRASSIVKGMLEHSRASTGVKEPTDINTLADEYLRLVYHGLRAKDNSFNATIDTHFDPDLPLVSVIPQDIGRVLLNLINNAFYAVHQRATVGASLADALLAGAHDQPTGTREGRPYQPTLTLSTQKTGDHIIIKVQDNGNGIPESIREKIFQPFFTTKPTGQGTGLGLSLAYDIVTKGHGGTWEVKSRGGGSAFTIKLLVV